MPGFLMVFGRVDTSNRIGYAIEVRLVLRGSPDLMRKASCSRETLANFPTTHHFFADTWCLPVLLAGWHVWQLLWTQDWYLGRMFDQHRRLLDLNCNNKQGRRLLWPPTPRVFQRLLSHIFEHLCLRVGTNISPRRACRSLWPLG